MLRTLAFTTGLAVIGLLSACGQDDRQAKAQLVAPPVPNMGLFYLDEGASAKLAYGEANTDNVGLMLQCAKGSRTVEVSDVVRSAPAPILTLASAGRRSDLKAQIESGEGAPLVVARVSSTTPALAGFRQSGVISVSYAGLRYDITARPQERAGVERFFSACDGRRA